jgi:acetylglutamate/LysW-gamma-L-alpha-aminoadipate kinase
MTNVSGLRRDANDPDTLISHIDAAQLPEYMEYAQGRMRKKVLGAQEALQAGVQRVLIGSESLHAVLNGAGTHIEYTHLAVERR